MYRRHPCWLRLLAIFAVSSGFMRDEIRILTALYGVAGVVDENAVKGVVVAVNY